MPKTKTQIISQEADQHLCFPYINGHTVALLSKLEIFKFLTIFCGGKTRFVLDLVGNPEDRFYQDVAHI